MGSCISYLLVYIPSVYCCLKTPKDFMRSLHSEELVKQCLRGSKSAHWGLYRDGELGNSVKHYQKSIRPVKYHNTCLHQFWDESLSGLSGNAQKVQEKAETHQSMTLRSTIMNVPNNFEDKTHQKSVMDRLWKKLQMPILQQDTCWSYLVNIMVANGLVMQGANASAAILLN